jgi:hypothetical protein
LASYLRTEILAHLRANACTQKTRVPRPKYPAEWLFTLRLTMVYSLLEEKHAEVCVHLLPYLFTNSFFVSA